MDRTPLHVTGRMIQLLDGQRTALVSLQALAAGALALAEEAWPISMEY